MSRYWQGLETHVSNLSHLIDDTTLWVVAGGNRRFSLGVYEARINRGRRVLNRFFLSGPKKTVACFQDDFRSKRL